MKQKKKAVQNHSPRSAFTVLNAVANVTFIEIVRDRVLYNILICAILLLGVGVLASQLTFIKPERVLLDFGLSAVSLSSGFLSVFITAGLLGREFERRTIHVALTRPISRFQFLLGKYLGVLWVVGVNGLLLSVLYLGILSFVGGLISSTLILALLMVFVQSALLAALVLMLSAFTTTSLSAMITVGFFLIGTNISQIRLLSAKIQDPVWSVVLDVLALLLPNFEYFNWGTKVTYGLPVTWQFVVASLAYGTISTVVVLLVAGFLIHHKEA